MFPDYKKSDKRNRIVFYSGRNVFTNCYGSGTELLLFLRDWRLNSE